MPIFRKDEKEGPENYRNYRLASVTLVIVKFLEQILLKAVFKQLKDKKVIGSWQYGFTSVNHA